MTSKNNRALLLYYVKLCASFQIHGWPWKTTGHLSYAASSFVHHFIDIGEFTLALQSGNAQFGQIRRFFSRVTLKFNGWPWKTIRQLFYTTSSFVHHFKLSVKSNLSFSLETLNSGRNWWFFLSRVTLEFDGLTSKTIGHISYAASSFLHHFVVIGQFKLELQSGNAQFGWN